MLSGERIYLGYLLRYEGIGKKIGMWLCGESSRKEGWRCSVKWRENRRDWVDSIRARGRLAFAGYCFMNGFPWVIAAFGRSATVRRRKAHMNVFIACEVSGYHIVGRGCTNSEASSKSKGA